MNVDFKLDYKDRGWHNFDENLNQPRHCWYPFKEGFSNQLVAEAIKSNLRKKKPLCVLDPFCGSGTTPLTAALLGHDAMAMEVNPFCAFTARVKCLAGGLNAHAFSERAAKIVDRSSKLEITSPLEGTSSFTEGNGNEKWLFNLAVIRAFQATWGNIIELGDAFTMPLQLAAIGAAMRCCNAKKDGKCLRYTKDWKKVDYDQEDFHKNFLSLTARMLRDIELAPIQSERKVDIIGGDARIALGEIQAKSCDLLITSPPYLNSFDYSDVYRPELFLGQFTKSNDDLRAIRLQTVRSHVQVRWDGGTDVQNGMVKAVVSALRKKRNLWNSRIPTMVEAYFHDMQTVLKHSARILKCGTEAWIVVSTSAYKGVHIPVDLILADLACVEGFSLKGIYVLRALRAAGQQQALFRRKGLPLRESLIVLTK